VSILSRNAGRSQDVTNGESRRSPIHRADLEIGWRVFYTQQHGDNYTWEILPGPGCSMSYTD
jgi:hypothetical protein